MATVDSVPACAHPKSTSPRRNVCRLALEINGTAYRVQPCTGKAPFAAVKAFWLRKAVGGRVYLVAQTLTGHVCNCPAFTCWDGPKTCKHVRALVAAGLLDADVRQQRPRLAAPSSATLAEHADHEANAYQAIGGPVATLFAQTMAELALKIRLTQATTPDEYEARIEVLDDGIREQWEARGYEEGRRAVCRCGEHFPD